MTRETFKQAIKKKMQEESINIPELARQTKCCQQTLYNYFAERSELSLPILRKVCKILNLDLE